MIKEESSFIVFLRRVCRMVCFFLWVLMGLPFQALAYPLNPTNTVRIRVTRFILWGCLKTLGIKIVMTGSPAKAHPCLFLSNHISYLDILILGGYLDAAFVSKASVRSWPIFGIYAKFQGSIFIDRNKRSLQIQRAQVLKRLEEGGSLILFPEGTTHNGIHVLPFKSSLLECVESPTLKNTLRVQPITICYYRQNGLVMGRRFRLHASWYGNLSMMPHIWSLLGNGPLVIHLTFHPELKAHALMGRKHAASLSHIAVTEGLSNTISASSKPLTSQISQTSNAQ